MDKQKIFMSKFSRNKLKYSVNEKFFDTWTNQMAYILGFIYADGNIHRTSLSWDIQIKDKNLLAKINKALKSTYPITLQRESSYRLRINNQLLIRGAINLGLLPKKAIRNCLPKIPDDKIRHFVRGFIDGDGWLTLRESRNEVDLGFCGGNELFIKDINKIISNTVKISINKIRIRTKTTPKGFKSTTYMAEYFSSNAMKIADWLYGNLGKNDLSLDRKYQTYKKVRKLYDYLESGGKKVRVIQKKFGTNLQNLLSDLYFDKHLDGVGIAKYLDVHYSSAYRWLEQTGIRYPAKREANG